MERRKETDTVLPFKPPFLVIFLTQLISFVTFLSFAGKGGKNRRRGKGDGEESKRELEFKEDGKRDDFWKGNRIFMMHTPPLTLFVVPSGNSQKAKNTPKSSKCSAMDDANASALTVSHV
jgi:hypothetical protein